jgi:hypothetical protein
MPIFSTPLATNPLSTLASSTAKGSEVVAYDAARKLALVLGPSGVDFLVPATGVRVGGIGKADVQGTGGDPTALLGSGNSVAIFGDTMAVAFDGAAAGVNACGAHGLLRPARRRLFGPRGGRARRLLC